MANLLFGFRKMFRKYVNSSFILITVTVLALVLANSELSESYFAFWQLPVQFQIGDFNFFSHHHISMTLIEVINDFLMAIFFFVVGLEIKREILVGELSSLRKALLPIFAALGGMIVPVCSFLLFTHDGLGASGAAIPMATDIAFSLGVLAILGSRVPVGLKVFLAALAVADDLGGIMVIALFYSSEIEVLYLFYASLIVGALILGAYTGIRSKLFYCLLGLVIWFLFLNSGVHATIAGVIVAFCIPARPASTSGRYIRKIQENIGKFPLTSEHYGEIHILTNEQISLLKKVETASDNVISPLQDLEDTLAPLIAYFIVPIFAFANAGINFAQLSFSHLFEGVGLSILVGLVLGKFCGILSFSWIAIKLRIVSMPEGADWKMLAGVSMLGGIGFTVSMFIANLSFASQGAAGLELLNQAKLGILVGSVTAGVLGYLILHRYLPPKSLANK